MEISIYSSDIRDFDRELDRKFDIQDEFGKNIFDDSGRLSLENYEYSIEPQTYIAVMIEMQEQIDDLKKTVEQLKHKSEWVSGYDDHGWNTKQGHTMQQSKKIIKIPVKKRADEVYWSHKKRRQRIKDHKIHRKLKFIFQQGHSLPTLEKSPRIESWGLSFVGFSPKIAISSGFCSKA